MAVKTKDFNVADYNFSEDKTITITKKHTALRIDNITKAQAESATYQIQDGKLLITSGGHTLTVENYQGIKYIKTDFQQINKKKSTFNLYDIISNNKVDNSLNPITQFNAKKFTATSGTNYNDTLDYYDSTYVAPTSGKNKDRGLTIKGGKGSDIITGTKYNDKITGGSGENVINVYTTKNFGNDEVVLTKGENLKIRIADISETSEVYQYCVREYVNNDLKISFYSEKYTYDNDTNVTTPHGELRGTITVKNYLKKDVLTSSGSFELVNSNNIKLYDFRVSLATYLDSINSGELNHYDKASYKGSWVNDDIRASYFRRYDKDGNEITKETEGYEKVKGVTVSLGGSLGNGYNHFQGSRYADTVKGGNGKDHIYTGGGNDTYTLGKGDDEIVFLADRTFDTDTINLTKGEKLTLNFSRYGYTTVDEFKNNIKLKVSGKNLIIEAPNGKAILKNFAKSNVVGKNGEVKFLYKAATLTTPAVYVGLDEMQVTSDKGTWHNDKIDKSDYEIYKTVKVGKTKTKELVTDVTKKGLTINGGAGSDEITGSNYSDTIKAGVGTGDNITGGTGNDKLYASTTKGSNTTFNFKAGDGKDTVYSGKGEDTLKFYDINLDTIKFEQGTKKNNKDLIIKYSDNDAVTVKNYYTVNKKGKITGINKNNTIKNIIGNGTNFIIGSELSETIDGTSGKDIIYANGGDDVINASAGDDIIYIGSGNSTVKVDMSILTGEVQQEGTEYEWVDYKENCVKTIYLQNDSVLTLDFDKEIFDNGCGIFCRASGQDNNLYISLSNSVEPAYGIVIKDYFDENGNPRTDDVKLSIWDGEETPTIYTVPEWANANLIPWVRTFDVQPFGEYTGEIRGTNMPNETLLYSAGFGDDTIYGGNGNKENIYLHGGSDTVHANEGTKNISIWGNQTDVELYLGSKETTKTNIHLGLVEGNVTSTINEAGDLNVSWDCYADSTEDTYTSTLRVDNWNNRTSEATISIGGNNRDNTLQAIDGVNNTLDGGDGDDILIGGDGIDTFNFTYNSEYGIDTVKNYTSDDILQFESASSFPVDFSKFKYYTNNNGKGLVINTTDLYNKESYVIIDNYFETDNKIDKVTTYNWSNPDETKSLATMYGDKSSLGSFDLGTDGVYAGTDNADVFIAKSGTNTYTGGKGSDTLTSNDGENTFVFNSGDGSDTLYQKGGNITLKFNDATIEELSSKTGYDRDASGYYSDLLIHYDGNENTLRVKDYFYKNYVTKIIDSTGTEYNMTDYFKRVEYINSYSDLFMRSNKEKDEDIRVLGSVSPYALEGWKGSDVIWGSDHGEWLCSYTTIKNDNTFDYDKTEGVVDKIHAGGGDDILVGNSSTNYLYGDEGNDTFVVFASEGLNTFVSDSLGTADSMNIYDETYDKLHFVFNIDKDGNMDSNGLRILNDENFNLWKANISDTNIKGINITEWNCVENFEEAGDGNGCSHLTISTIETVKNEIASWLTSEGYTDVSDVFANEKTAGDITTLLGKYDITDKWQYEAY